MAWYNFLRSNKPPLVIERSRDTIGCQVKREGERTTLGRFFAMPVDSNKPEGAYEIKSLSYDGIFGSPRTKVVQSAMGSKDARKACSRNAMAVYFGLSI